MRTGMELQGVPRERFRQEGVVLLQFGSELMFELEPFRTGPKFSSRSRQEEGGVNLFEPV